MPRVLITAGPTHEPIDAVRYIGNRSSGRMGVAIAAAAAAAGCPATVLLGPVGGPRPFSGPPEGGNPASSVVVRDFRTTADLEAALAEGMPGHDILIMAAAVADYRPIPPPDEAVAGGKLRRTDAGLTIELEPTPDLLAGVAAAARPDQTLIGFALEPSERLAASARSKLVRKGVHAIVANPLETMNGADVTGTLVHPGGIERPNPPRCSKEDFAVWLVARVLALHQRNRAG